MNKALAPFFIVTLLFFLLSPRHSYADKFFEDDDAFFLKYLKQNKFAIDTSASAIVLYECTHYDMNLRKLHVRKIIKIIKKSGIRYADISIPLPGYRTGYYFVSVNRVHGITYNIDKGKIVKHEIDEENVSFEKTGLINEKKISMPAVREGSVIDYSYELNGVNTSKWDVQENIPKLYTKLELCVPVQINMTTDDNSVPVFIKVNENDKGVIDSVLPYSYTYEGYNEKGLPQESWVRRNVSAFEDEPYIPCKNNYREMMDIHVNSIHFLGDHGVLNTWDKINLALVESYHFYRPFTASSALIKEKARRLAGDDTSDISIAKKIFKFVRDSIFLSGYTSIFNEKDIQKILEERSGSAAEINFLLIALLHQAGLSCSPVILATKANETPSSEQAEFFKYNSTICQLRINGEKYYLDAAEKYNPFGRIPPDCLNGYARVIDKESKDTCGIILSPDMAKENALYAVTTTNNSLNDYTLNFKFYYGDEASIDKRKKWNKDTAEVKNYILRFIKDLPFDTKIKNYKVLNLSDPEKQLTLDFNISIVWPTADSVIYFNPYAVKFFENNPFKTPKRKYPVELPAIENLTYTFSMKLPDLYTVEEAPKSGIIKIDDGDQYKNMFGYNKETNTLDLYSRLQMQRIYFLPNEYDVLKGFFEKMSDEQQKTLVIKKQ